MPLCQPSSRSQMHTPRRDGYHSPIMKQELLDGPLRLKMGSNRSILLKLRAIEGSNSSLLYTTFSINLPKCGGADVQNIQLTYSFPVQSSSCCVSNAIALTGVGIAWMPGGGKPMRVTFCNTVRLAVASRSNRRLSQHDADIWVRAVRHSPKQR